MVRCTTGNQRAIAVEATRIDVELAEHGWVIVVNDEDGDSLLTAAEVAHELGVTAEDCPAVDADGRVPSVHWADRARGDERRSRLSDVSAVGGGRPPCTVLHNLKWPETRGRCPMWTGDHPRVPA
jgi:hypothetical protein